MAGLGFRLAARWRQLRELWAACDLDAFKDDAELHSTIELAFCSYCNWFDKPWDYWLPSTVISGPWSNCFGGILVGGYTIMINSKNDTSNQRVAAGAEQMCHRALKRRRTATREYWVEELISYQASQQVLKAVGLDSYAECRRAAYYIARHTYSLKQLRKYRRQRTVRRGPGLAAMVRGSVVRVGCALESTVGWECTRNLARAHSWDAWIYELDPTTRAHVLAAVAQELAPD